MNNFKTGVNLKVLPKTLFIGSDHFERGAIIKLE
jgi:hypothetical protein